MKAYQREAFVVEGAVNEDVDAWAYEMKVVAVACLEMPLAQPFAVALPVAESVEDFVDIPAADWQQEEMDVDQEEEEDLQKAWNLEVIAFGPPEQMHQEIELIMASELQHQESFPHFDSIQQQMVLELLDLQVPQNYQACDQLVQGFAHHSLYTVHGAIKHTLKV